MIKVGIIDSGFTADSAQCTRAKDFTGSKTLTDNLGHGTAVAEPFRRNPQLTLLNARVFDRRLVCCVEHVAQALEWLIGEDVRLINMSFGLTANNPQLEALCREALANNIVLVAASPAQGQPVFPAAYPAIIRATGDARCRPGEVSHLNSPQADFGGYPGNPHQGPAGASVGCAWVSAFISHSIQENSTQGKTLSAQHLRRQLRQHCHYHGIERRRFTGQAS